MKPKWQKKLAKKELEHIRETSDGTLESFKKNLKFHRAEDAKKKETGIPFTCYECFVIAKKLGL